MEPSTKREEHARALLWTAAVTLLLLVPVPLDLEGVSLHRLGRLHVDKWIHAVLFFLLTRAWFGVRRPVAAGIALGVALAAGLYGGLLEIVQGFVGRDASWGDFAADLAGALVAGIVLRSARRVRKPL